MPARGFKNTAAKGSRGERDAGGTVSSRRQMALNLARALCTRIRHSVPRFTDTSYITPRSLISFRSVSQGVIKSVAVGTPPPFV
jgi:hypothetical protein